MEERTLKELRAKFNLKQTELAKALGISPVTISHWENGSFHMTKLAKIAIGSVLGIDWHIIKDVKPNKWGN